MHRQSSSHTRVGYALFLALVLGGATGCDDMFRKASELGEEPQIITVRATPPEAGPGQTVTFDALLHWPQTTPTLLWLLCRPGIGGGPSSCVGDNISEVVPPSCDEDDSAPLCVLGVQPTTSYTVPTDTPAVEHVTLSVVLVAVSSPDALPGCLESFAAGGPGSGCELAVKRLVVSSEPVPNANPLISGISVNGEVALPDETLLLARDVEALDDLEVELSAQVDATSIDELSGPEPVEFILSWFSTCGTLDPDQQFLVCSPEEGTQQAACEAPPVNWKPGVVGLCEVHAVVRDGRGGTGFFTQSIRVQ